MWCVQTNRVVIIFTGWSTIQPDKVGCGKVISCKTTMREKTIYCSKVLSVVSSYTQVEG